MWFQKLKWKASRPCTYNQTINTSPGSIPSKERSTATAPPLQTHPPALYLAALVLLVEWDEGEKQMMFFEYEINQEDQIHKILLVFKNFN